MRAIGLAVLSLYAAAALYLLALRWIDPPFTMVQAQRRMEALFSTNDYRAVQRSVPLEAIPLDLQRAVVAAEDGAFYSHHGFDWAELALVLRQAVQGGRLRGASTISQQLVKNLLLTTHRVLPRKLLEYALTPLAELLLSKDRILELYLNQIEWGPGVWGVWAAADYHYGLPLDRLTREQAARLAACIPSPRSRRPSGMDAYSAEILARMEARGW